MHVIIVQMKIKEEHVADFEAEMKRHIGETRKNEPGCVQFDVAVDKEEPRTYHLIEMYADEQALADHGKSESLGLVRERTADWVEERAFHSALRWPEITA